MEGRGSGTVNRRSFAVFTLLLCGCGREPSGDAPGAEDPAWLFRAHEILSAPVLEPAVEARQILEAKGGGLAVFDANGDGHLDLFLPGAGRIDALEGQGASLLFGDGVLGFSDSGTTPWRGFGMGTAVGDADGDGRADVFVAAFGVDALLFGEGDGLAARPAGVEYAGWSSAGSFCDLDGDGDLDLAVARYLVFDPSAPPPKTEFFGTAVFGGPAGLEGEANGLFENDGTGRFRDRSAELAEDRPRATLGVVALDLDLDGAFDLYFGNDSQSNRAYFGTPGQPFAFNEAAESAGLARNGDGHAQATMGIAVADVNGDGAPDLFTTNFARDTNTLLTSASERRWRDATARSGLAAGGRAEVAWGCVFTDFDRDGREDLVVVNGHVYPDRIARELGAARAQAVHAWRAGESRFERLTPAAEPALSRPAVWRSLVAADLDGDGDRDLVATALGSRAVVFERRGAGGLLLELRQVGAGDRAGLGARVEFEFEGTRQTRFALGGGSYQASGPAAVELPAGITGPLTVVWPDGTPSRVEAVPAAGRWALERDGKRATLRKL